MNFLTGLTQQHLRSTSWSTCWLCFCIV